jgi:hypothetical protein
VSALRQDAQATDEHIPPQAAFNDRYVVMQSIANTPWGLRTHKEFHQNGFKKAVLCADCNNRTGGWYGTDYAAFAQECASYARATMRRRSAWVSLSHVRPARVLKQALVIMCASGGLGFKSTDDWDALQQLTLNPATRGRLPGGLRIFCYVVAQGTGKTTGIVGASGRMVAEFSWWPLGWVVTYDELPVGTLRDVTHWTEYASDERVSLAVPIPCLATSTAYPLDYRTRDEVDADAARNLAAAGKPVIYDANGKLIADKGPFG